MNAVSLVYCILLSIIVILLLSTATQATEFREVNTKVKADDILKHIENGDDINLTNCHIVGELNVSNVKLKTVPNPYFYKMLNEGNDREDLIFCGVKENSRVIESSITIEDSHFENYLDFSYVFFNNSVYFDAVDVNGSTNFMYTIFNSSINIEHTGFSDVVDFSNANFNDSARFRGTHFNNGIDLSNTNFNVFADFEDTFFFMVMPPSIKLIFMMPFLTVQIFMMVPVLTVQIFMV